MCHVPGDKSGFPQWKLLGRWLRAPEGSDGEVVMFKVRPTPGVKDYLVVNNDQQ